MGITHTRQNSQKKDPNQQIHEAISKLDDKRLSLEKEIEQRLELARIKLRGMDRKGAVQELKWKKELESHAANIQLQIAALREAISPNTDSREDSNDSNLSVGRKKPEPSPLPDNFLWGWDMPILAHGYVKQEMEWNEVNNEDENHICNELVLFLGVYSDFYAKDILEEEALAELEGMIE